uniref:Uncharacterized protein n=1 Tax=Pseudonaja textilis TaxID=8673 RepID=A0A670ZGV2_PSETE
MRAPYTPYARMRNPHLPTYPPPPYLHYASHKFTCSSRAGTNGSACHLWHACHKYAIMCLELGGTLYRECQIQYLISPTSIGIDNGKGKKHLSTASPKSNPYSLLHLWSHTPIPCWLFLLFLRVRLHQGHDTLSQ